MIAIATTSSTSAGPMRKLADIASLALTGIGIGEVDHDAALVRKCRKGDMTAYRQLVERHERRVVSIISRIIDSRHGDARSVSDVDDLAQEVFVQAWRALPSFRGDARFSTWLYRIATNRAIKEWRRAQRRPGDGWCDNEIDGDRGVQPAYAASEVQLRLLDPEMAVQLTERDAELRGAVDALPEKQRTVILLHYFEEYSCEEIAQILDCSVGTVWSRLHYACRKLRAHLGDNAADARGTRQ